jgi:AraC-like DNA-binding protein
MHSVSRVFAQSVVQLAEREGLALPAPLVAAVRGAARVPLATQDALWEAYCRAGGPTLPGLRVGLALQVAHLDSAGLQLVACETLGEALDELAEVAPAIGEGGRFELERDGALAHLVYRPRMVVRAPERVEAVLASALNLARWATGGRFAAAGLWFAHAPLAPREAYAALLDAPLAFGAARASLGFDAAQLALPLVGANAELHDHLRALTVRTLASLSRSSLAAGVQRELRAHPGWGRERVAAALALSGRHLVRRLALEGLSFKALREAVLDEMACDALAGPGRVADIAAALGFADEGTFVRAFRRWRGTTPARWRAAGAPAPGRQR